jgi:hypothetical protein
MKIPFLQNSGCDLPELPATVSRRGRFLAVLTSREPQDWPLDIPIGAPVTGWIVFHPESRFNSFFQYVPTFLNGHAVKAVR